MNQTQKEKSGGGESFNAFFILFGNGVACID